MHNDLVADANESALNFIETGIMPRKEIIGLYGESWTCINNMAFFSSKINSTQIGYKTAGIVDILQQLCSSDIMILL